jgi:hypothetical protein
MNKFLNCLLCTIKEKTEVLEPHHFAFPEPEPHYSMRLQLRVGNNDAPAPFLELILVHRCKIFCHFDADPVSHLGSRNAAAQAPQQVTRKI